VTAYILSDVIGDDLRVVASGPTAAAIGSPVDAMHVLKKSNLANRVPSSILAAQEQPGVLGFCLQILQKPPEIRHPWAAGAISF
jgi:glycerate-2-kinase